MTIIFFLALLAARDFSIASSRPRSICRVYGGMVLVTLTVGLTLFSGSAYLWKNRRLLRLSEGAPRIVGPALEPNRGNRLRSVQLNPDRVRVDHQPMRELATWTNPVSVAGVHL